MSLLVFVLLTGLLNVLGVFTSLGEVRDAIRGDSGTLKVVLFSATLYFRGDGDHVTLFLGVLETGLLRKCNPEEARQSSKALTGVLRIPFSGLITGLRLVGVSTTRLFLAGDLKGLPLRAIPSSQELPATGLSATEKTRLLERGGVLGLAGVRGVLGVLISWLALPRLPGDFVGVLFGL